MGLKGLKSLFCVHWLREGGRAPSSTPGDASSLCCKKIKEPSSSWFAGSRRVLFAFLNFQIGFLFKMVIYEKQEPIRGLMTRSLVPREPAIT